MPNLSRARSAVLHNDAVETITVRVDDEAFLVPPEAWLQVTSGGLVYLAYAGDAPMLAHPIKTALPRHPVAAPADRQH